MFNASQSPISNMLRLTSKQSDEPTLLPQLVLCPEMPSEEEAPPLAEPLPPPPPPLPPPSTDDDAVAAMLLSPSAAALPPSAWSAFPALACRRRFFDLVAAPMYFRRAVCADVRGVWNNSSEKGFECTNFTTEAKSCTILELPLLAEDGAPPLPLSAVDRRLRIDEVLE